MQCGEILDVACALIMEDREGDSIIERCAPGIINSFLCEMRERAKMLGADFESIPRVEALTDSFPYPDKLISPCLYYLASRLIRDENADAALELMERCDRQIAAIDGGEGTSGGDAGEDDGGGSSGDSADGVSGEGSTTQVFPGSTVDVYAGVN